METQGPISKNNWSDVFLDHFAKLGYPPNLVTQWSLPKHDGDRVVEEMAAIRPRNILEIGTFVGFTTLLLAHFSQTDSKIHTVDPNIPLKFELQSMHTEVGDADLSVRPQELGLRVAQRLQLEKKITFHSGGFSTEKTFASSKNDPFQTVPVIGTKVCEEFGPFDCIFIDGLHYTNAVLSDLRLAHQYLEPGGLIILHDVIGMWGSNVRRAVHQFLMEAPGFVFRHGNYSDIFDGIGVLHSSKCERPPLSDENSATKSTGVMDNPEFVSTLAGILYNLCHPRSAVYLGKDRGGILSCLGDLGVQDLLQVGGNTFGSSVHDSSAIEIESFEFQDMYRPRTRFDLGLCVGDGDELDDVHCRNLILSCVNCSDTIFFGTTPPGEIGAARFRSRPLRWWVREFWKHGYRFHDDIRPILEPLRYSDWNAPIFPIGSSELTNLYLVRRDPAGEAHDSRLVKNLLEEKESRIEDLSLQGIHKDILIHYRVEQGKATQKTLSEREVQIREIQESLNSREADLLTLLGAPKDAVTGKQIFSVVSCLTPYLVRFPRIRRLLFWWMSGRPSSK